MDDLPDVQLPDSPDLDLDMPQLVDPEADSERAETGVAALPQIPSASLPEAVDMPPLPEMLESQTRIADFASVDAAEASSLPSSPFGQSEALHGEIGSVHSKEVETTGSRLGEFPELGSIGDAELPSLPEAGHLSQTIPELPASEELSPTSLPPYPDKEVETHYLPGSTNLFDMGPASEAVRGESPEAEDSPLSSLERGISEVSAGIKELIEATREHKTDSSHTSAIRLSSRYD